ncbi:UDP-N-acetylglucosamine--N-acetylmuramyl-(pentapeptide) pyrophosphoryl-undecaprenol N-acetylglucosamine transferase [Streptoalloteichus tenebrarius]|uniref:UDP-N-acetylglucosamine--N-acetylmuramyl- (pentapeptide) pyrophosphoryl-undecaprenol N-acetylglucosamine transferase n=1 Tax=Streptoalloteichus tenebrarius (strain ATCC 17920 / DSM 40477 / JCM 4838 / CBS 697.72 / NBRC 16177 / NCIMB 11028 / NRRL B-12390 / A12253. 1 / ISP 5477) TaxID=1933 RepID=UPI0020A2DABE|nr:UDP-N-acetylglucosamine--N-acetylmuramyl-(pentapeptide) pyrophosphoryl-undecaprenol N-acetylglucosamine transferase [Streptoalloteichus tenebrarius]
MTGGGTGGHTYPALTTVHALRTRLAAAGRGLDVVWVGTASGLEARVAAEAGIAFVGIAAGKIDRGQMFSLGNVRNLARAGRGVGQARSIVAEFAPDAVLATGGYVAVPVGLAAALRRRPLVVHEQTTRLGLANRVLARVATRVAVSSEATLSLLPQAIRATTVVTGNPVRPEVLAGRPERAVAALGLRGFAAHLPVVYVTGGAQGARQINALVRDVLPWLLTQANVIHQCGPAHLAELQQHVPGLPAELAGRYHLTGFLGVELPDVLALADVVISRSGAGTCAELTALGRAAILVPLASSAGGEQAHNARHLHQAGAAVALLDEVSPACLRQALEPLISDPGRRGEMAARARALGRPDAADRLAEVVLSSVPPRRRSTAAANGDRQ